MNKQKKNVERVYKYFVRLFSYSTTGCLLCVVALRVVVLSDGDDEVAGCFSLPPPSLLSSSSSSSFSPSPSSSFSSTGSHISGLRFSQGQSGIVARPVSATPAP